MRKHLVWVLGLALAIGITAIATAENTQKLAVTVSPSKAPKTKYVGTKLHTITEAGATTTGAGAVKPATRVQVYFDNDIKFNTKGIATCSVNKVIELDTAQAKAACPKAIVGTGKATAFFTGDPNSVLPGVITAFNGPPKGGKSTIILHTRVDAAATTTALTGVLSTTGGDLGNRLDVVVPPLPAGTALGLFDVTVTKKTGNNQYVSLKCGDKDKTLNFKGVFNYDQSTGPAPTKTLTAKQKCTVKN